MKAGVQVNTRSAREVSRKLLAWYLSERRDLPWRHTKDPYQIWLSEIMLQQTRVETVIPFWKRFIDKFPALSDLAEAGEDEVLKLWEGLGYYSRARNFHAAVREVVATYGGAVPASPEEFSKLPGVGPYTTGAVLSIAYNRDLPAVDGNVFRVLSRIFLLDEDISKPKTRGLFEGLAVSLIPDGFAGEFNQALMELGAMICIPKSPRCQECPVHPECAAYKENMQTELPVKGAKLAPRVTPMYTVLLGDKKGKWAMRKRPDHGLLAGLWEFPTWSKDEASVEEYMKRFGIEMGNNEWPMEHFADVEHVFSHLHWKVTVFRGYTANDPDTLEWVSIKEMENLALPAVHQRLKRLLEEEAAFWEGVN